MNKFNNHYCQHNIPAISCSICSYTRVQTNVSLINVGEINEPIGNSEQLPVAWMHTKSKKIFQTEKPNQFDLHLFTPLYVHPIRDDEDEDIFRKEQVEKFYAEARPLREKYKFRELSDEEIAKDTQCKYCKQGCYRCDARKTLTEEEIANIWDETKDIFRKPSMASIQQFARAIIKASRGEK